MSANILTSIQWNLIFLICFSLIACEDHNAQKHTHEYSSSKNLSSLECEISCPHQKIAIAPDKEPDPELPSRDSNDWQKAVDASRFLQQASFGATAKDINFIIKNSKEVWLEQQFSLPQTRQLPLLDEKLALFGYIPVKRHSYYEDEIGDELGVWSRWALQNYIAWDSMIWQKDQLRQRVAFALSQFLVVSHHGAGEYARERGFARYHDILAENALGHYEDLLLDITLNPIMGIYLSSLNNPKADLIANTRPDENYAREILQLFSIGLNELNIDGTEKKDKQGNPIATYDQEIVKEFSRVFTGFSYASSTYFSENMYVLSTSGDVDPMKAYPEFHDYGAKKLLNGQIIPANNAPYEDIKSAIKNIMAHPNVAPFVCKKLIQYLITSNPSNAYVARVARVFNDNGMGVKGDMKAVVKAIYLDQEAEVSSNNESGKLKEFPLQIAAIWRAFKAQGLPTTMNGATSEHIHFFNLEVQQPYWAPSVFNYYQSDYKIRDSASGLHKFAPEFQVFNQSSAVYQANVLSRIIYHRDQTDKNLWKDTGQAWGTVLNWNAPPVPAILNISEEIKLADKPEQLIARINLLLAQGKIISEDSRLLAKHLELINDPLERVYEAIFFIAVSPEFAIQG
jgi:uncharacterized protein (DUF1800 family)